MKKEPQFYSSTFAKGLKVIEELAFNNNNFISIKELSHTLEMDKTSVYRIINTLLLNGYVIKKGSEYKLGPKLLSLSAKILDNLDIREIAKNFLLELACKSREMAFLSVLDGNEVVFIDKYEGNSSIRIFSKIGSRFPLYCTSTGKLFLAFMPKTESEKIISNLDLIQLTPSTITDKTQLKEQLNEIRQKGYAFGDLEHDLLKRTIGAPIFNHNNEIVAAIGIAGSNSTLTENRMHSLYKIVVNTAKEISKEIGQL